MLHDHCSLGTVDTRGWFKNDSPGTSEVKTFTKRSPGQAACLLEVGLDFHEIEHEFLADQAARFIAGPV